MQQIADWLEKLGMSEYAQRFAENGIDDTVLPDLTDQDLKDIVVLLGHRRKLLRAIAELNSSEHEVVAASAVWHVGSGSFTTDAFSTGADQCPLLLQ